MVESRDGRSSFVPHKNNAVRFTVDAFLFKGTTGQVSRAGLVPQMPDAPTSLCLTASHALLHVRGQLGSLAYSQVLQLRRRRRKVQYVDVVSPEMHKRVEQRKDAGCSLPCLARWVELSGADSVCSCCDATCSSSGSAGESLRSTRDAASTLTTS